MTNINELITNNFNKNISYIESYHPTLLKKLSAYESAISNGHYQENYELVYENNNFDVLEKSSGKYLYDKQTTKHTNLAVDSINFHTDNNAFITTKEHKFTKEELNRYKSLKNFSNQLIGYASIIDKTNNFLDEPLKSLEKFIFFGTGLGLHIDKIDTKIKSKVYLIVEDDIELFRLSLFCIDYSKIGHNSEIIFSVFEDDKEFTQSANNFLTTKFYYNKYIKFFLLESHNSNKIDDFHLTVSTQPHLNFWYSRVLNESIRPLEYFTKNYNILTKGLKLNSIGNKPFLLVAPGPSLTNDIEWLKDNQNRFIIVAVSASLSILEEKNIKPDIVIHLDGYVNAIKHFEKLININFIDDSIILASSQTSYEIVSLLNSERLFFFESKTKYVENSLKPAAPCVGSLSYQLLLYFNVENIYLLGLNLAVDNVTKMTHHHNHEFAKKLSNDIDNDTIGYKETLIDIKGNTQDIVQTTPHFISSIESINNSTALIKQSNQKVYNLSSGAKFENIDKLDTKDVDNLPSLDKKNLNQTLFKLFKNNATISFDKNSILKQKLSHAKILKKNILKYKGKKYNLVSNYIKDLTVMCETLTDENDVFTQELSASIDGYIRYIAPYIFDFFNKIDDISYISQINNDLINHLLEIVEYYQGKLNSYV